MFALFVLPEKVTIGVYWEDPRLQDHRAELDARVVTARKKRDRKDN